MEPKVSPRKMKAKNELTFFRRAGSGISVLSVISASQTQNPPT